MYILGRDGNVWYRIIIKLLKVITSHIWFQNKFTAEKSIFRINKTLEIQLPLQGFYKVHNVNPIPRNWIVCNVLNSFSKKGRKQLELNWFMEKYQLFSINIHFLLFGKYNNWNWIWNKKRFFGLCPSFSAKVYISLWSNVIIHGSHRDEMLCDGFIGYRLQYWNVISITVYSQTMTWLRTQRKSLYNRKISLKIAFILIKHIYHPQNFPF